MFWHRTISKGTVGSHLLDWPGKYISTIKKGIVPIPISIGIVSSGKILNAGRHARRSDVLGAESEGHPGASNILYLPRRLN